jgi:hypothetical protein
MATPARLREAVLGLPERDRAELARDLIRSLDDVADANAAEAWGEVIERRAREVLDGAAEVVDGNEAVDRVRARLRHRQK